MAVNAMWGQVASSLDRMSGAIKSCNDILVCATNKNYPLLWLMQMPFWQGPGLQGSEASNDCCWVSAGGSSSSSSGSSSVGGSSSSDVDIGFILAVIRFFYILAQEDPSRKKSEYCHQ